MKSVLYNPLVSVIVPSYNHASFLIESLNSVISQTHKNLEIIVVDDGSKDNTRHLVSNFNDNRIKYIWQHNQGLSAARNKGINVANGSLIVFLDADDRLLSNHITMGILSLRMFPNVGFVCGDIKLFGETKDFQHIHNCSPSPDHYASLLRGCFIVNIAACLFYKETLVEVGGFNEHYSSSEDWDIFLRIARKYSIYCHHVPIMEYRRISGQMSSNLPLMLAGSTQVLRSNYTYSKDNIDYLLAYQEGKSNIEKYYGIPVVDLLAKSILTCQWNSIIRLTFCIAVWYQKGILYLVPRLIEKVYFETTKTDKK